VKTTPLVYCNFNSVFSAWFSRIFRCLHSADSELGLSFPLPLCSLTLSTGSNNLLNDKFAAVNVSVYYCHMRGAVVQC
jgi:hypothetical protein